MKKFGRKTTLNLRYGSDMGSHSVVSDWKGYDFMEIVEKKETNADRIRNMSDEELAEFINNVSLESMDTISYGTKEYDEIWEHETSTLDWLQSEAE